MNSHPQENLKFEYDEIMSALIVIIVASSIVVSLLPIKMFVRFVGPMVASKWCPSRGGIIFDVALWLACLAFVQQPTTISMWMEATVIGLAIFLTAVGKYVLQKEIEIKCLEQALEIYVNADINAAAGPHHDE